MVVSDPWSAWTLWSSRKSVSHHVTTSLQGSDREPGASGAEDASGRRSGRLSVKIRLKSAAQPSPSPGTHIKCLLSAQDQQCRRLFRLCMTVPV